MVSSAEAAELTRRLDARTRPKKTTASFDEIDVLMLAQINALQLGARSVGVGRTQGEHSGFGGRDRHQIFLPGARLATIAFGIPPDGVTSKSVTATARELVTTTTTDGVTFFRALAPGPRSPQARPASRLVNGVQTREDVVVQE
jgi:hypothetical protein